MQGQYDKNKGVSIVFGPQKELPKGVKPENLILMGDCVKKYRKEGIFIEGCPPGEPHLMWGIVDRVNVNEQEVARRWELGTGGWGIDMKAFREYQMKLRQKITKDSTNKEK